MFLSFSLSTVQSIPFVIITTFLLIYTFYIHFTRRIRSGMRAILVVPFLLIARYILPVLLLDEQMLFLVMTSIDCFIALMYIIWFTSTYGQYSMVTTFAIYTGVLIVLQVFQLVLESRTFVANSRLIVSSVPVVFLYLANRKAVIKGARTVRKIRFIFFLSVVSALVLSTFQYEITDNIPMQLVNCVLLLGYFLPLFILERSTYQQAIDTVALQNTTITRLFEDLREISAGSMMSSLTEEDSRQNIDAVLDRLINSIAGAINPDGVIILLLDQFNENLEVRKIYGVFPPVVEIPARILRSHVGAVEEFMKSIPIKPGSTFLGEVFTNQESLYIRSITRDQQIELFADTNMRHTMNSLLVFPLHAGEKNFGVVALARNASKAPFNQVDFSQAELLARYTSLVIDNRNSYIEVLEKQQIEQEIGIAADIQVSLLPTKKMMQSSVADIEVFSKPLKGVSGDYFDMLEIPNSNSLAVLICDVAGKGIPASLLMVLIRTVFHTAIKSQKLYNAGDILTEINTAVNETASIDRFATILILLLTKNPDGTISLDFANAGHHPLIAARKSAGKEAEVVELDCDGIPVGVDPDFKYVDAQSTLNQEDLLVLYTDGISEIRKGNSHEEYGSDRIQKIVQEERSKNTDLPSVRQHLLDDMDAFSDGSKQHDDQTMVMLKIKGA